MSFSIVCHAARYFFVWLYCAKGPWNLNTLHSKVSTNWFLFPVLVWVALMMMAETGGWGVSPFPFYQNLKQSLCSDGFLQHHHLSWPLCHLPRTWENAIHCCLQCIPMRGKCNTLRVTWFWAYCRRLQKKNVLTRSKIHFGITKPGLRFLYLKASLNLVKTHQIML